MSPEHRRVEDTLVGQIMYFWPLIAGVCMLMLSVGGYIVTIRNMSDRVLTVEVSAQKQNSILDRLTTLQEVTNDRIESLENWRNGVRDIYKAPPRNE